MRHSLTSRTQTAVLKIDLPVADLVVHQVRWNRASALPEAILERSVGSGMASKNCPTAARAGLVEGVVGGEQHLAGAGEVEGVAQQALLQHSAAGDVDVGRDVVRHPAFEVPGDAGEAVGPVHPEQQHLPPVTEHELKTGVAVERAPQDQPQRGQPRVHVPAPAERGQAEVEQRVQAPVGGIAQLVRRDLRVDEDGLMQAGRGGEQVIVGGVIQRAGAGPPVDHGADVT